MALAVGNNGLIGSEPGLRQQRLDDRQRLEAAVVVGIGQLGPLQVDGAGDVAAALGQHPLAAVLLRRAGIPDRKLPLTQMPENLLLVGDQAGIDCESQAGGGWRGRLA